MATCLVQQRGYAIRFFDVAFLVRALPMAIGRGAGNSPLLLEQLSRPKIGLHFSGTKHPVQTALALVRTPLLSLRAGGEISTLTRLD